ncbi:MAG: LarC family nickel insertion protein [Advenella sp.]
MHLHLDPVGGVAGDMFIAAIFDTFPHLVAGTLTAIESAGLPSDISLSVIDHKDHVLAGRRFMVAGPGLDHIPRLGQSDGSLHRDHDGTHDHEHVTFAHVRDNLMNSTLAQAVKLRAIAIFSLLAQAEAKVHGSIPDEVTFHEVGAWDSIADIVGAAYLVETINEMYSAQGVSWSVAPLPLGSGWVNSAHGLMPVPAPATALLLRGMVTHSDGIEGERITPTGAAILRHLQCETSIGSRPRCLLLSGIGFGTRSFPGISNVLRVMAFDESSRSANQFAADRVAQLSFEIDDQSPEDLAVGLDRLRKMSGVIDVTQLTSFGKKGRMASQIQVLVHPATSELAVASCFSETTTIGVRVQSMDRYVLIRENETVDVNGRVQRLKKVVRPGGVVTVKAEMDDIAMNAANHVDRQLLRTIVEKELSDKDTSHD